MLHLLNYSFFERKQRKNKEGGGRLGLAETHKGKQWGGGGESRLVTLRERISTETLPNVIKKYVAF